MAVNILNRPNYIGLTSDGTEDGPIVSAYNRNVIEWNADAPFLLGEIKITDITNSEAYEFKKLVPNADTGSCKFDIWEVAKAIMQKCTNAKLSVRCTVNYADTTTDFVVFTIRILRSVSQFGGKGTSMQEYDSLVSTAPVNELLLLPYKKLRTETQSIKLWYGYPFEVHFINDQADYFISNDGGVPEAISSTVDVSVTQMKILDGTEAATSVGKHSRKILLTDVEGDPGFALFDFELIDDCGVYLRWVNPQGGYSFWMFGKWFQTPLKSKSLGVVQKNYDNIKDLLNDQLNIGQDVTQSIKVYDNHLTKEDYDAVMTIARAKDIWMYTGDEGSDGYDGDKWQPIRIINFSGDADDTRRTLFKIAYELELPKLFTQVK